MNEKSLNCTPKMTFKWPYNDLTISKQSYTFGSKNITKNITKEKKMDGVS